MCPLIHPEIHFYRDTFIHTDCDKDLRCHLFLVESMFGLFLNNALNIFFFFLLIKAKFEYVSLGFLRTFPKNFRTRRISLARDLSNPDCG